ncbi:ABC transporter substrate-binding protein [Caballeronia ptereochthonis]|uniref:Extracellular solute-binding protein n=1 Tax=Caballeronia ptereochthonis TaxID=1777144 RepID=A0A158B3V8_9BURK|nr:ABC transporter substrate-binding protein [Caballeronia ptereochthonis]SAK64679.1 extracellular solute-binding protein [Caballeronia ptereochthonis]
MQKIDRRGFLTLAGAALAASAAPAFSATSSGRPDSITVRDAGGSYVDAFREAFYLPFEAKTGIKVVPAASAPEPTAQIKAMVEAKSYLWDVALLSLAAHDQCVKSDLLEPLNIGGSAYDDLPPEYRRPHFAGVDVYTTVLAYRADKVKRAPQSWQDFWNVNDFPGRRALRNFPFDTVEIALMADGVPTGKVYPCDLDRSFASLNRIRPAVNAWWTAGAQSTQLLQTGEVDMIAIWNGAAQRTIDAGAPVKLVWNQNIAGVEGWCIVRGTPKAQAAREFVAFAMQPQQQALLAKYMSYGPANPKAYEHIDPKRAQVLSTNPDYRKVALMIDNDYWVTHKDKTIEQFNAWRMR